MADNVTVAAMTVFRESGSTYSGSIYCS